jgi:Domain of unknown function (DUF397)
VNEWRKPSGCPNNATCVEVMEAEAGFYVRDAKDEGHGPALFFTRAEWAAFLAGVNAGEFDAEDAT